jgi:hypothetical protein
MRYIQKHEPQTLSRWWRERTALEKIGACAVSGAVVVVATIVLFPHAAAAVGGGALASGGAYLMKKGFGK